MIAIISIFFFILWLFGAFGIYTIGWPFHILLGVSILLMFIAAVRTKKPEVTEIMGNSGLPETEAERVKEVMSKNKLDEQEAVELLDIRSGLYPVNGNTLVQTKAKIVKGIMNKNKLSKQEAASLLSIRLKLRHR